VAGSEASKDPEFLTMSASAGTPTPTVLVTGSTGRLGALVTRTLCDQYRICPRALVRPHHVDNPDWAAPDNLEVAVGDFLDHASIDAALRDVDAVFLVSPVHPDMRKRELAVAEQAARQPNPPRIVKISGLGTHLDSPVDSGRWHAEIEQGICNLGLSATFLRPLFVMQNFALQLPTIRKEGILRGAFGDAGIAMVDARDVAEVAAAVLMGGSTIDGQAVPVTGAHAYTFEAVARALSLHLGRDVMYQPQTIDAMRVALGKAGQPDWHVEILLQFGEAFRRGWGAEVADTVERVLRRAPRSLEEFLLSL
jgi:uncharacterized protein YbjT (DUF2867 family)